MIAAKKQTNSELLTLALLLSLLRPETAPVPWAQIGGPRLQLGVSGLVRSIWGPSVGPPPLVARSSLKNLLLDQQNENAIRLDYNSLLSELATLGHISQAPSERLGVQGSFATYLLTEVSAPPGEGGVATEEAPPPLLQLPQPQAQVEHRDQAEDPLLLPLLSPPDSPSTITQDLSIEDMNLIESLWKQDVDIGVPPLGASLEGDSTPPLLLDKPSSPPSLSNVKLEAEEEGDEGPLSTLDPWTGLQYTIDLETGEYELCKSEEESGVDCLVLSNVADDDVHEEEVAQNKPADDEDVDRPSRHVVDDDFDLPSALGTFSLEEALNLASLDSHSHSITKEEIEEDLAAAAAEEEEEEEGAAAMSNPSAQQHGLLHHHHHHHPVYAPKPHHLSSDGRMPMGVRGGVGSGVGGSGGGWVDVGVAFDAVGPADVLPPPPPHHQPFPSSYLADPRSVLLHNASLAPPPPMPDFNATAPLFGNSSFCGVRESMRGAGGACGGNAGAGAHLGSAVAASMNLSAPEGMAPSSEAPFKLDHDSLYYQHPHFLQNASGGESMNQSSTEGFFSSILNDEELQLVDMAMNEGMYTMRLLDNSTASGGVGVGAAAPAGDADGSSDSAVSSMGSERAWGTEPSTSNSYLDYCATGQNGCKYRPYDYSGGAYAGGVRGSGGPGGPPGGGAGAQKKHHMFAKRYFNETNEPKCLDFGSARGPLGGPEPPTPALADHVNHNHTYQLPGGLPEPSPHPRRPTRDKNKQSIEDAEHLTRDEKRARSMHVPISVEDIINLPMDEFNERLSKFDLTEAQLSLIRDIRRRGKNKVAAQNCRKRKLDQILSLADEVKLMRHRKHRLLRDKEQMQSERQKLKDKFAQLYRHVFQQDSALKF
ncbi:segmentation protein cap'n'collar isoform X4 [Cloeon dipterum]|uniref:segmentation protein cap'n'collar isoform X4 n=1 Tax=Cloeon dipterum TaxID=197152 RepID=UPI0032203A23